MSRSEHVLDAYNAEVWGVLYMASGPEPGRTLTGWPGWAQQTYVRDTTCATAHYTPKRQLKGPSVGTLNSARGLANHLPLIFKSVTTLSP